MIYFGLIYPNDPVLRRDHTLFFYLTELPVDPKTGQKMEFETRRLQNGDTSFENYVEIEGMFLRICKYKPNTNAPIGPYTGAVLYARSLRIVPPPPEPEEGSKTEYILVVSGLATLLIGIILFAGYQSRKYGGGSMRSKVRELKQEREQSSLPLGDAPTGSGKTGSPD